MYFIGVGKVQLITILLRLIFTTYLVPEGSGNGNCRDRLRKPVFSSVAQLDKKDVVLWHSSVLCGGGEQQERVGGVSRVRKGFWILEALSSWEGPPGCVTLSFP